MDEEKGLSPEEKIKEQNRIRQCAYKLRGKMPKDLKTFMLVASHLIKNAHRYWDVDRDEAQKIKIEAEEEIGKINTEVYSQTKETSLCIEVNKKLREIRTLKRQNRIREQQNQVEKLKAEIGSYRNLVKVSGVALKTVHDWCSEPKERIHKAVSRSKLKQEEFVNFLMQDTITFSSSCKKYAGKRFLVDTWAEVYKKYLNQPEYHQHGIISKSTMRSYKPKYILLSGSTPLSQCLCDYCENCELMMHALVAAGIKGIPPNKYLAIEATLCDTTTGQFGTDHTFGSQECIRRLCDNCGGEKLKAAIKRLNEDLLKLNNPVTWHRWQKCEGFSAPQKCLIRKPLRSALNDFTQILEDLSSHIFRSNWHRGIFEYMKKNLQEGCVLQVMDFAMNFNNWYQDEVQAAYWCGTQTTIHATINFFRCPRKECNQIVTLALVHISDDLKHDSFLSRATQNLTFKYLANLGIPLELVIQFCDNCAAQYKSRRPFAELARIAIHIIRVYFGEKHGKSHADALFGRLKAWMTYNIRTRHFVVKNAYDFFKFCRDFYQTPAPNHHDCCQLYRVEFEFVRPCDIRRKQDCDLDKPVDQTHDIYSVRNTPQPLKLKVRNVPCLCPPCIKEEGQCWNEEHTDPWREVDLIPEKGSNLRKYDKRKRPDHQIIQQNEENNDNGRSSDEELPDIIFEDHRVQRRTRRNRKESVTEIPQNNVTETVTEINQEPVESARNNESPKEWRSVAEEITQSDFISSGGTTSDFDHELINLCETSSEEFRLSSDNILIGNKNIGNHSIDLCNLDMDVPDEVYWDSILSAMQSCQDFHQLVNLVLEIKEQGINDRPLQPRKESFFVEGLDMIDDVAQSEIPLDGPTHYTAIKTNGDGNCFCRAVSKGYYNTESKHNEIRARIVIEGVLNMDKYLSDDCLERGATYVHNNAELPLVFATFSDYYTPGQKLTKNTINYIYSMEIYSCSRLGSYMGIWQLAQSSSVLGIPIHSIYPVRGDCTVRNDFNRMFFPVEYPTTSDDQPLVIMWTGVRSGGTPVHFVPLINSSQ